MHDHDRPVEDDQPLQRRGPAERSGEPGAPGRIMRLQRTAGNRAVASLLTAQRDEAEAQGLVGADPVVNVDPAGIGQTVAGDDAGGAGAAGGDAAEATTAQTLPVQRDGATGGGGGGGAVCPIVSWPDFADADESQQYAAQSAWIFGFAGGFTVSEDTANMWAKPSAKNDATNGPVLLRHEQYHFKLACVMADKATAAQGRRPTSQADFNRLVATTNRHTRQYDNDTNHGLNSGPQSTWEGNIDGANLTFP